MDTLIHWSNQHPLIKNKEMEFLKPFLADLRGYHLALLGTHRLVQELAPHHLHAFTLLDQPQIKLSTTAGIYSSYHALPFRDGSLDASILFYLLEYVDEPLTLLKELFRSFISGGKLFLFCFQRWHPWCWLHAPACQRALSLFQVKQLLQEAEFTINRTANLHYGAIHFIEAQKNLFSVTPLKPAWQVPTLENEVIQPTARSTD